MGRIRDSDGDSGQQDLIKDSPSASFHFLLRRPLPLSRSGGGGGEVWGWVTWPFIYWHPLNGVLSIDRNLFLLIISLFYLFIHTSFVLYVIYLVQLFSQSSGEFAVLQSHTDPLILSHPGTITPLPLRRGWDSSETQCDLRYNQKSKHRPPPAAARSCFVVVVFFLCVRVFSSHHHFLKALLSHNVSRGGFYAVILCLFHLLIAVCLRR